MPETDAEVLRRIESALDEIRSILKMIHQDKLEEVKNRLLPKDSIKKQIYDMCDGTRTTQDIAKSLQKETGYASSYITILRREGLVKTVEREGMQVHEQVF